MEKDSENHEDFCCEMEDKILPSIACTLDKLKEYLVDNYGFTNEDFYKENLNTIKRDPPASLSTGYATCSKEIHLPSSWNLDEEDQICSKKLLTAPLRG